MVAGRLKNAQQGIERGLKDCDIEWKMEIIGKIPAWRERGQSLTSCNAATPAKSKMAARTPQNGQWGMERRLTQGMWALP